MKCIKFLFCFVVMSASMIFAGQEPGNGLSSLNQRRVGAMMTLVGLGMMGYSWPMHAHVDLSLKPSDRQDYAIRVVEGVSTGALLTGVGMALLLESCLYSDHTTLPNDNNRDTVTQNLTYYRRLPGN